VPESIKISKLLRPLVFVIPFATAHAQSVQELEKQVLLGQPAPTPAPTPEAAPSDESAARVDDLSAPSNDEVEVTGFDEKKTAKSEEKSEELEEIDEAIMGPKEIPADHIFVVQQRYIRKEGRHEVTPVLVGVQLADSFRRQINFGFSYTYHFSEAFGLEVAHASFVKNYETGLNNDIRSSTGLETDRIEPVLSVGSAIQWTPLRSKAATDESIYHFEGYFILGGGMTKYETGNSGLLMYGLGFRSYVSREATFKAELRNYRDRSDRLTINLGASVLFGGDK